ncbi:DDE-domain-containing protein [Phytophthora cinnamomi]|uniref:DDE-domain-containing protein n=1 Tax=Phytophthora cinnamomi TaxID=4785 RepID=UPI00355945D0|nr:DDE-domain-containing protein [Phytophthora cinnamomi]
MKARDIQRELCDAWELGFSDGWLTAFERRHRLRYRNRPGEAGSADPAAVAQGRQRLQEITDLYPPKDIYNMDEMGLCNAMAPARSIWSKRARGVKKKKTRITLAFTANADGTDALPVLFLGRAKQPRCFEKCSAESLGFSYRANAKAWMTGPIFREWLHNLDREMRAAGRHILLLLDNASSHRTGDLVCTNVRVEFLPPNTTTFLQPMDAGIIALFKRAYRRRQLHWVYEKVKDVKKLSPTPSISCRQ